MTVRQRRSSQPFMSRQARHSTADQTHLHLLLQTHASKPRAVRLAGRVSASQHRCSVKVSSAVVLQLLGHETRRGRLRAANGQQTRVCEAPQAHYLALSSIAERLPSTA